MWTPDRDAELRRLGAETYIARYPGADAQEVQDRYRVALLPWGLEAGEVILFLVKAAFVFSLCVIFGLLHNSWHWRC